MLHVKNDCPCFPRYLPKKRKNPGTIPISIFSDKIIQGYCLTTQMKAKRLFFPNLYITPHAAQGVGVQS